MSLVAMRGRMGQESNQCSLNSGEVNSVSASKQLLFWDIEEWLPLLGKEVQDSGFIVVGFMEIHTNAFGPVLRVPLSSINVPTLTHEITWIYEFNLCCNSASVGKGYYCSKYTVWGYKGKFSQNHQRTSHNFLIMP